VLGGGGDVGVSATGIEGGAALGAGVAGGAARLGALGLGAAFLATTLGVGLAFLGAARFATFIPDFFAFAFTFAFTFAGRAFFFATLFLAAGRLAFAIARFFDLLFFAMVNLLLEIIRTHCESSPEKVCCHLCVMLESVTGIA
jgi:hypothetical protein